MDHEQKLHIQKTQVSSPQPYLTHELHRICSIGQQIPNFFHVSVIADDSFTHH